MHTSEKKKYYKALCLKLGVNTYAELATELNKRFNTPELLNREHVKQWLGKEDHPITTFIEKTFMDAKPLVNVTVSVADDPAPDNN